MNNQGGLGNGRMSLSDIIGILGLIPDYLQLVLTGITALAAIIMLWTTFFSCTITQFDWAHRRCWTDPPPESSKPIEPTINLIMPALPSGLNWILFTSEHEGRHLLSMLDIVSNAPIMRIDLSQDVYDPVWAPNRTAFAFSSGHDIYILSNLTGPPKLRRITIGFSQATHPTWSPDGTRIAFEATHDDEDGSAIFVVDLISGQIEQITHDHADNRAPSWSPDGRQIAFVSHRDALDHIFVIGPDGEHEQELIVNQANNDYPAWSPDGSQIAFASTDHTGNKDIFLIKRDGSDLCRLTKDPANDYAPAWSPDGTYIVFETFRAGNLELYRMRTDGSEQTNLTQNPEPDHTPDW